MGGGRGAGRSQRVALAGDNERVDNADFRGVLLRHGGVGYKTAEQGGIDKEAIFLYGLFVCAPHTEIGVFVDLRQGATDKSADAAKAEYRDFHKFLLYLHFGSNRREFPAGLFTAKVLSSYPFT